MQKPNTFPANNTTLRDRLEKKAYATFAIFAENLPKVREGLTKKKIQRHFSNWQIAAKESKMET